MRKEVPKPRIRDICRKQEKLLYRFQEKMMRKILITLGLLSLLPLQAYATDEFGTRFGGRSPAALGGNPTTEDRIMALEAERLQNIETAAGDETPAEAKNKPEKFGPPVPAALQQKSSEQTP
jgi:hypothetical protein